MTLVEPNSAPNLASREALAEFARLLRVWNRRINLLAQGELAHLENRHIADSLQLLPLIPPSTARGIDLGTGAGFPGLVLAIATGIGFDLVEADRRKAAFLREAARITGAPVQIYATRIESAAIPPATLVTARALAPLPALLPLVAPKLAAGGIALLPKGAGYASELTAARAEWQMDVEEIPSRTAPGAAILRISDLRRVLPAA